VFGIFYDTFAATVDYMLQANAGGLVAANNGVATTALTTDILQSGALVPNSSTASCGKRNPLPTIVPKMDLGGMLAAVSSLERWSPVFMQQNIKDFLDYANPGLTDRRSRLSRDDTIGFKWMSKNSSIFDRIGTYILRVEDVLVSATYRFPEDKQDRTVVFGYGQVGGIQIENVAFLQTLLIQNATIRTLTIRQWNGASGVFSEAIQIPIDTSAAGGYFQIPTASGRPVNVPKLLHHSRNFVPTFEEVDLLHKTYSEDFGSTLVASMSKSAGLA
jgi:hypothetical protein